ncbi:hypothetical protein B7Z17_01620, partial [Candidatus Saccharibacteria bacterium 32-49-10]
MRLMVQQSSRRERGDTLVEVLLSITILAVAITAAYTIMSRMFAVGMVSLERSQTQAILNGQAAMIRDAQRRANTFPQDWNAIKASALTGTPNPDGCSGTRSGGINSPSTRWFFLDPALVTTLV